MNDPIRQSAAPPQVLERDSARIAYHRTAGRLPGVVFLGGFMSDMAGTKATALEAVCRAEGRAYVRFDYTGHGQSSGRFEDGTIGGWARDAVAVLDELTEGPQVLVGSSMGGWIMILAARQRPERVAGLVGIAAAPDFTEDLVALWLTKEQRAAIERDGVAYLPSESGERDYPFTRALLKDGKKNLVLRGEIPLACPVALVHGMDDREVPFEMSLRLAEALASRDVTVTLVKDGGHRMSEPDHLGFITAALAHVLARAEAIEAHGDSAKIARKPAR
jgi:pimeloyl-ACP methyl ester carboxylesterase